MIQQIGQWLVILVVLSHLLDIGESVHFREAANPLYFVEDTMHQGRSATGSVVDEDEVFREWDLLRKRLKLSIRDGDKALRVAPLSLASERDTRQVQLRRKFGKDQAAGLVVEAIRRDMVLLDHDLAWDLARFVCIEESKTRSGLWAPHYGP
jgi:hypothetical protein